MHIQSHGESSCLPGMSAPRTLIVGCGRLGMCLVKLLKKEGHFVVATTTTPGRIAEIERGGADLVLGPDQGGGYYLVGLRASGIVPRFVRTPHTQVAEKLRRVFVIFRLCGPYLGSQIFYNLEYLPSTSSCVPRVETTQGLVLMFKV